MTEAAMFVIVCTLVNKFQNEYQIDSPILLDFHVTSAVQTDEYAERKKLNPMYLIKQRNLSQKVIK